MEKIKLKVGDVFTLTKSGSLYYKILELDNHLIMLKLN